MTDCINPSDRGFESSPCLGFHLWGSATVTRQLLAPERPYMGMDVDTIGTRHGGASLPGLLPR